MMLNALSQWLKGFARAPRQSTAPRKRRTFLAVEPLEDRRVPVVGAFSIPAPISPITLEGSRLDGVVKVGTATLGDICTGSLLHSGRHVLTAAHCVDLPSPARDGREDTENVRVKFELVGYTYTMTSTQVDVHPRWTGSLSGGYDFAILTLPDVAPLEANRYDLYRSSDEVGKVFQFVGYGRTGTGTSGSIAGTFGTKRAGYNKFDGWDSTTNLIFDFDDGTAATNRMGDRGLGGYEATTAFGDSGGPSFISGKLAAVTSGISDPASRFGNVAINGRVSLVAPWIDYIVDGTLTLGVDLDPGFFGGSGGGLPARSVSNLDSAGGIPILDVWSGPQPEPPTISGAAKFPILHVLPPVSDVNVPSAVVEPDSIDAVVYSDVHAELPGVGLDLNEALLDEIAYSLAS